MNPGTVAPGFTGHKVIEWGIERCLQSNITKGGPADTDYDKIVAAGS